MIPRRRWSGWPACSRATRARIVVALGDNFHDGGGPARLAGSDRAQLLELQRGRDWVWIAGNHDPDPREGIGGAFARSLALGPLAFRHEPAAAPGQGGKDGETAHWRDRRPSASRGPHPPARPHADAQMLCRPTARGW